LFYPGNINFGTAPMRPPETRVCPKKKLVVPFLTRR
jgi:hypothetical protein